MATEAEAEVKNTLADEEDLVKETSSRELLVQLRVMDINNGRTKDVFVDPASTIADLKREVQNVFDDRPAPEKQRLIFRGKHCENTERLGHVLRGLDLTVPQKMTLLLRIEDAKVEQRPAFPWDPPVTTRVGEQPPILEEKFWTNVSRARQSVLPSIQDGGIKFSRVSNGLVEVNPWPFKLKPSQVAQLRRQYQHALRESREALTTQREQHEFLTGRPAATDWPQGNAVEPQPSRRLPHWQPSAAMESEVATTEATRALGGNMPGPAAGAAVRDITGPLPEGLFPAAGLDENVEEGRFNRVDPAPHRPDFRREFRVFLKMFLQLFGVVVVFGIDVNGWVLFLLALVGFVAVLVKTGIFEALLGGSLWKSLCSAVTVISERGGLLTDVMYFWSAFFLSLFPTWKPQRSPEVIAAEAAAREASRAAAQEAIRAAEAAAQEAVRTAAVAQEVRAAGTAVEEAARVSEAATQESESKAEEDSEAAGPAPSEVD